MSVESGTVSAYDDLTDFDLEQAKSFSELEARYKVLGRLREIKARLDGSDWQESVVAVTTGNVADFEATADAVDSVNLSAGDLVGVFNQTDKSENGIYYVAIVGTGANGVWYRAEPMLEGSTNVQLGAKFYDENQDVTYVVSAVGASPAIVGETNITFTSTEAPVFTDLASNANGEGASMIGIEDAAGLITATTVEGALAEIIGQFRFVSISAGAEVGDVIPVTIQVVDNEDNPVNEAMPVLVQVFNAVGELDAAAFRVDGITGGGDGTRNGPANAATAQYTTDANGDLDIDVSDVVGASGSTVEIVVTPVNELGGPVRAVITFD
jgi:enamine deaminase RidA (YjgF/YER057c/UK114 family)